MKKLNQIFNTSLDINISGITDDSRLVEKDFLFVATFGYNVDHYNYIPDAIKNGCVAIISSREYPCDIPIFVVDNINDLYVKLCVNYYDVNFDNYNFFGITGTDGKTTTASIINQLISECSYIGTNGLFVDKKFFPTNNTTPCISELCKDLSIIKKHNISNVVMEVSSEALLHNRVNNICYSFIGFTNITGDHLNVHGSFDNYLKSKLKILNLLNVDSIVVVNNDDLYLRKISCPNLFTYGFSSDSDFYIFDVKYYKKYTFFSVKFNDNVYKLKSPYLGIFNVYNVTLAFAICLLYGLDSSYLIKKIKYLKPVFGRCEFLDFGQDYDIVIDYAHTINGVKNILNLFSDYKNVITVTGCAGGRDTSKRSIIGKIIMNNSDVSIFTADDPRFESVDKIIDDMVGEYTNYLRIVDREDAINYALSIADSDSVVLILGKGRDNYMAIGDKKIPYSDFDVISRYFENV